MNDIEIALEDLDTLVEIARQHTGIASWLGLVQSALIMKEALEKQLNSGWIPVKKKLPDTNKDILVTLNDGKVVPARYLFADNLNHITAWQPLPPAYKEVENE